MSYYVVKLVLRGAIQETSRTIKIPSDITFKRFHEIIQIVFGFDDYHNYSFGFVENESANQYEINMLLSKKTYIENYFEKSDMLFYEYDFGDGWVIDIKLIDKKENEIDIPELMKVKGRFNPPEDCGGIFVFNGLIFARKNKESLKKFNMDEQEFKAMNKFDTQNKLRVLYGYEKLERPKKDKIKQTNTLDKYFNF